MKQIDPSEINIINYLSGEMSADELNQFEIQLEGNQLLKAQVEEMRIVQKQIGLWQDSDIEIPPLEALHEGNIELPRESGTGIRRIHLPNWARYAAVFLGFVMLLQISGFKVNHNGNTLMLSFGEPNT